MSTDRKNRHERIIASLEQQRLPFRQRSIFLRHLDCGSCNACELELHALTNVVYDVAQYGIHFVASPRHADVILMTGIYTRSLDVAAQAVIDAMPVPRVITIGDCAQGGGIFHESYAICQIPERITRAIIGHVPGCPPEPGDILQKLLNISLRG